MDTRLRHGQLGGGVQPAAERHQRFLHLILELSGPDVGAHSHSAVGLAELPFDIPVEIEGEVEIDG